MKIIRKLLFICYESKKKFNERNLKVLTMDSSCKNGHVKKICLCTVITVPNSVHYLFLSPRKTKDEKRCGRLIQTVHTIQMSACVETFFNVWSECVCKFLNNKHQQIPENETVINENSSVDSHRFWICEAVPLFNHLRHTWRSAVVVTAPNNEHGH